MSEEEPLLCEDAFVTAANPSQILTNGELFFSFPDEER